MIRLTLNLGMNFGKWSRPKPTLNKNKEVKKSFAIGDDKAAKLSKSEHELQNKQKMLEMKQLQQTQKQKKSMVRNYDRTLQQYMTPQQIQFYKSKQLFYLKGVSQKKKTFEAGKKLKKEDAFYLPSDNFIVQDDVRKRKQMLYGNYTSLINQNHFKQITEFDGHQKLRRVGSIGTKLGMTTMWNKWGRMIPVTIIQLDRVQVIQIKNSVYHPQYCQVQVGFGEKNFKRLTKSELGHYVKARVPPKKKLFQFKVSKECLLPVGFMIGARHYTPGMYVDVIGKTVGHGFQGTIKKWGFRRQPESHGNSTTTRVLGSTGGRQDPGRVFKMKKMYGRMGGKVTFQNGLQVFKVDVEKNLVYLRGSVPGKAGTVIRLRDTILLNKAEQNLNLVHFPTFIEEKDVEYANQVSMYCGERDPEQIQIHDNAYIVDDGKDEEGAGVKQTELDE